MFRSFNGSVCMCARLCTCTRRVLLALCSCRSFFSPLHALFIFSCVKTFAMQAPLSYCCFSSSSTAVAAAFRTFRFFSLSIHHSHLSLTSRFLTGHYNLLACIDSAASFGREARCGKWNETIIRIMICFACSNSVSLISVPWFFAKLFICLN